MDQGGYVCVPYSQNNDFVSKIYVSSFKGISGKWQLPTDGGSIPYWEKGRIVYLLTGGSGQ